MVLLFLIEAVVYLISLPFVLLSQFLPELPNVGNAVDTICNQGTKFINALLWIMTMGGNSTFVGCFRFCLATIDFIVLYWLITKVISLVKSIFIKED